MGRHPNIGYGKWPRQGHHLGQPVEVLFNHGGESLMGMCVRDDVDPPYEMIIKLDDGRHVRSAECQYRPVGGLSDG